MPFKPALSELSTAARVASSRKPVSSPSSTMFGKTSERNEQGCIFAPGELWAQRPGHARSARYRTLPGAASDRGGFFLGDLLLAAQKKVTCRDVQGCTSVARGQETGSDGSATRKSAS